MLDKYDWLPENEPIEAIELPEEEDLENDW